MRVPLKEMIFLYHLSENIYKKPILKKPLFTEVQLKRTIELSLRNDMFYYYIKKILKLYRKELSDKEIVAFENIIRKGERELKCIENTILFLNNCLDNYLLIKTYRGYARIPNDIDILVDDFETSLNRLKDKGFQVVDFLKDIQEATLIHNELYKVHLHAKISWGGGAAFMDKNLLFKNPRITSFNGIKVKIPNFDADFLMHIAHMNFEPLHFTLSELLYLYKIAPEINWDIQFAQSEKYHWFNSFKRTLIIFDKIYHTLYSDSCPFILLKLGHKPSQNLDFIILPKTFSRMHLIKSCFERKLFVYVLNKWMKVLIILFTGKTDKDSYIHGEKKIFKEDIYRIFNK